jgi:protein phosphatase
MPRMSTTNGTVCPTFVLKYASASDLGMRRSNNQDALAVMVTNDAATWATRGHLLMVADGMGAHAAGELASKLAVDNIPHTYMKLRDLYPPAALRQAIRDANAAIHAKGQSSIGFQGMGTTCSVLVLLPQGALVAHIGDSRVYRLRGQMLEQLTFDHSLVWEMAAAGQMAEQDVPSYIPKNVITRSLGPHATVHVDLEGPYSAAPGDTFLICSDGLSGPISDEELGALLQCLSPEEAAASLVDLANLRGGPDNISLIVAQIDGEAPQVTVEERGTAAANGWWPRPLLLIAAGAFLAGLIYSCVYQYWTGAIISAVGFVASTLAGLSSRSNGLAACAPHQSIGGPYGNGPYRKAQCPPDGKLLATFEDISKKLRELPVSDPGNAAVNWEHFDEARSQATAAAERGDHAQAIRQYSLAIRQVMKQLRAHRPTIDGSDRF